MTTTAATATDERAAASTAPAASARLAVRIGAVLGIGLLATVLVQVRTWPVGTYGGQGSWLLALEATAAAGLLVLGLVHHDRLVAALLLAAGLLWLLPELSGWATVPAELRTSADAARWLLPPLVAVALLQVARPATAPERLAVVAVVAGGIGAALTRLLLVDPFLDPSCWWSCRHNPFLVTGLADAGPGIEGVSAVVCTAGVAVLTVEVLRRGTGLRRWAGAASGVLLLGLVAPAVLPAQTARAGFAPEELAAAVAADVGAVVLAGVLVAAAVREWWVGVRVLRLAGEVATSPRPGMLAAALGAAVGDPQMRVLYPMTNRGGHVDAKGNDVATPVPSAGERVTAVGRRGRPLALLVHAADLQPRRLDRALTPALRLALENERLRAAVLAEFREAQGSRMRLVEAATEERRRLERNLHDGVQQRVVSLSLLLNLVERRVPAGPAAEAAARASRSTRALLEELRRVARGIYPAVLADSGLADAALDLAESSTGPAVTVDRLPEQRCDVLVETTAYAVLAAALDDARARAATAVSMSLTHEAERLVVEIHSDGGRGAATAAPAVAALQDQVQALGGRLRHPPETPDVRLELPCES